MRTFGESNCQPIKTRTPFTWFSWRFSKWRTSTKMNEKPLLYLSKRFKIVRLCGTFHLQRSTKVRGSKLDPCQVLKVAVSRRLTGEALGRASLSAKLRDGIEWITVSFRPFCNLSTAFCFSSGDYKIRTTHKRQLYLSATDYVKSEASTNQLDWLI